MGKGEEEGEGLFTHLPELLRSQQFRFSLRSCPHPLTLLYAPFSKQPTMSQPGAKETTKVRRPGRLISAWHVLMGVRVSELQMRADWLEYRMVFEDILTRFGAQLARNTKTEKERVARELTERPVPEQAKSGKAAVRARAFASHGPGKSRVPVLSNGDRE